MFNKSCSPIEKSPLVVKKIKFHVYIGAVKFATSFKESPVAQGEYFRASDLKGMDISSRRGLPFLYIIRVQHYLFDFFCVQSFFFITLRPGRSLRKDIKPG